LSTDKLSARLARRERTAEKKAAAIAAAIAANNVTPINLHFDDVDDD
jgi:hypothetical protein